MNIHALLVLFPVYHASSLLHGSVCGVASLTHFLVAHKPSASTGDLSLDCL